MNVRHIISQNGYNQISMLDLRSGMRQIDVSRAIAIVANPGVLAGIFLLAYGIHQNQGTARAQTREFVVQDDRFEPLFDGHTLAGWEGNEQVFRVVNGTIVAGTTDAPIQLDEFLCTTEEFRDFELKLEARMTGAQIAGVQFRGQRIPDSTQVGGYQADMGFIPGELMQLLSDSKLENTDARYPLWGSLLDEYRPDGSRYPDADAPYRLLAVADRSIVDGVLSPGDWNEVTITAVGPSISIRLNGMQTVDYVEQQAVPRSGLICLQIHSGPPSQAAYRRITVRRI
jgi:hypothetical protein